jgi:hypothetical protein
VLPNDTVSFGLSGFVATNPAAVPEDVAVGDDGRTRPKPAVTVLVGIMKGTPPLEDVVVVLGVVWLD